MSLYKAETCQLQLSTYTIHPPYLYLYLFFGVDDSIVDDFTQRGDHSLGPMRNHKLTGMVV